MNEYRKPGLGLKFYRYIWGDHYMPIDREEVHVEEYPPEETAIIRYFSAKNREVAKLRYTHPCNAYLGQTEITGPSADTVQSFMEVRRYTDDPKLGDILGIFPQVWSWVMSRSYDIANHQPGSGVAYIEVENPPHEIDAYSWVPDPDAWGAYDEEMRSFEEAEERLKNRTEEERKALYEMWRDAF